MNRTNLRVAASAAALLCGAGWAAAQGIHVAGGRNTNWPWTTTDSAGYRWDVNSNGQVDDGTNDCYDGAMLLRVGGSQFSWSSPGKLSKDGREVEVGPWAHGSIRVWRRIYVDKEAGYCRWIDIFENTAGSAQTAAIQYYTNMGGSTYMTYTTSGQANLKPKDWGIVTSSSSGSSRPSVVHVFATRASKLKPRFQWSRGNDNIYYHVSVNIPAKKTVALCFFEAQRRPYSEAQKFLKAFKPEKELRKVPTVLRRMILNMGGAVLTLGRLELPRSDKHDLVVLRNGNELLGTIGNERFLLETFFDKLDLPAERVIGLSVPIEGERIELGMIDGQVICGKLLNAPLKFKLANGSEMELPPAKIRTASYRLSGSRPDEIAISGPMIVLRSGERLYFDPADADLTFHTRYGDVKLSADDLKTIYLDTPEGGLHRAVFRNGSVLSGLLTAADLKLGLQWGATLAIRRHLVERFVFPGEGDDGETTVEMKLRNDDELLGRITDKALTVKTRFGEVVVAPKEIAELVFPEASLGRVQIKLHNGTTISGQFVGEAIRFEIGSGPTLAVSVGHIHSVTGTKAKASGPAEPPVGPPPRVLRTRTEPIPIDRNGDRTQVPAPRQDEREEARRKEIRVRAAAVRAKRARMGAADPRAAAKAAKTAKIAAVKLGPARAAPKPERPEPPPRPETRAAPASATTRPAARSRAEGLAWSLRALTEKRDGLVKDLVAARDELAKNPGQAEAATARKRIAALSELLALLSKQMAEGQQRLAALRDQAAQLQKQQAQLLAERDHLRKALAKGPAADEAAWIKQRIAACEERLARNAKTLRSLR